MDWTHEHVEVLAAAIFTLAFLTHLARSVTGWALQLGPYTIPMWASWVIIVVAGYLMYHFWRKILA